MIYHNRENLDVHELIEKIMDTGGTTFVYGAHGTGKRSILIEMVKIMESHQKFLRRIFWLNVGKIETVMELLTLIDHIGHDILYDVFGKSDNIYRPENIEDWVMYIKSNSQISEIVLFLDDVCDQFVVDVFSLLRTKLIISTSNSSITVPNKCATVHVEDLSISDSLQLVGKVAGISPEQYSKSLSRLLGDISRSPLEVQMIAVLLRKGGGSIDEIIDQLITKRVEVASAMIQKVDISERDENWGLHQAELPCSAAAYSLSANANPLVTRVMPRVSTSPSPIHSDESGGPERDSAERNGRDSNWWLDRMRKVSVYITLQMLLESLPEHIQVKYVLLGVVPASQPVSLSLLRVIWKLESNDKALDVVRVLLASGLIRVDRPVVTTHWKDGSHSQDMFILHSLQHDYLYDLLSLPIWHNRAQVAANRLIEYLTDPALRSEEDPFFDAHVHKDEGGITASRPRPATFVRIGLYFRKLMRLGQENIIRSPINPVQLFDETIRKMNRTDEVTASVRYLVSACTAIEEIGHYDIDVLISWYRLLLSLMEEDPASTHAEIAQYTMSLGILFAEKSDNIAAQRTITKALGIYISVFGTDHYSVCSTYATLANIAQKRGCFADAIHYYREILEIKSRLLGTRHPRVARDLNNFAMLLASQNEFSEAMLSHMGAVNAFKHSYGESHTETVNARGNMGITMLLKGDVEGLVIIQESICMLVKAGFSIQHPWLKKFLDFAQRGELGNSVSEGIDVENATFQPLKFTRDSNLSSLGGGAKSQSLEGGGGIGSSGADDDSRELLESNLFETSGLSLMSGMGLHRLNATPLLLSQVETCHKLVVSSAHGVVIGNGYDLVENKSVGAALPSRATVHIESGADTNRLPFAALVLTE